LHNIVHARLESVEVGEVAINVDLAVSADAAEFGADGDVAFGVVEILLADEEIEEALRWRVGSGWITVIRQVCHGCASRGLNVRHG
jgi:hypothetical protein